MRQKWRRAGWKGCVVACAAGKSDAASELDDWFAIGWGTTSLGDAALVQMRDRNRVCCCDSATTAAESRTACIQLILTCCGECGCIPMLGREA